ncbi:MAG: hypothetical protein MJZ49_02310 [Bacteroidales bacterium]|nr:hypothetical protein [Bacteroidales bacterium]
MKCICLFLAMSLLLFSCGKKEIDSATQLKQNQAVEEYLETGDLIFVGLPMSYSLDPAAVNPPANEETCAGDSLNVIHVAMVEVVGDSTWVIDATLKHNVARYPLDTFLADFTLLDGSMPLFIIKRLVDNRHAKEFVENAKQFIGQPYDIYFSSDKEAQFCSELVRNSYVADGVPLFGEYPMNFQKVDGTFPIYWKQLFQLIHLKIPQDKMGTTPAQMMSEEILKIVDYQLIKK